MAKKEKIKNTKTVKVEKPIKTDNEEITVKKLLEMIDSIDLDERDDDNYTEDELYDIGCAFISMSSTNKREFGGWERLFKILKPKKSNGEPIATAENFRTYIKSRRYSRDAITPNPRVLSDKTVEQLSFEGFENQVEECKQELFKEKIKTRDWANSYRKVMRESARVEEINSMIAESIEKLNDLPEVRYTYEESPYRRTDELNEAVMLLSDAHIGMEIDNFYNKYDANVALKRLNKYVDDTIELCKRNEVYVLNVLNLGDMIHGIIHITARIETSQDIISQIMLASEYLANALNRLQEAAPIVRYRSCTDNHSRVMPSFKENIEKENYSRLIDFYLKSRLEGTKIEFPEDNLDIDIGYFELLNGKKLAFVHGHRDNAGNALMNILGATKQFCDYICVGHWHKTAMNSCQGSKIFINASICGPDSYAQSKRLYGSAEQTLLIFERDNLSVNYINLDGIE